MPYPEQPFPSSTEPIAFPILKSTGENSPDNEFYIGDGICYSTYSLETGSFLKIEGLNSDFRWGKNEKVFIEMEVGLNLGIRNAKLKKEMVGSEAPEDGWGTYPAFYSIIPRDEIGENGKIKYKDGKRQQKCYVLIGYLNNDSKKNGDSNSDDSNQNNDDEYDPVQILTENIILIQTVVSGVPCVAPFPYFKGGLTHLQSIVNPEE